MLEHRKLFRILFQEHLFIDIHSNRSIFIIIEVHKMISIKENLKKEQTDPSSELKIKKISRKVFISLSHQHNFKNNLILIFFKPIKFETNWCIRNLFLLASIKDSVLQCSRLNISHHKKS